MTDGTALVQAINWIEKEAKNPNSRFYNKINLDKIAAMGMSCGGIMSYGAAHDPHVKTVGIWNSGLFSEEERKAAFDKMHGTAIIITGVITAGVPTTGVITTGPPPIVATATIVPRASSATIGLRPSITLTAITDRRRSSASDLASAHASGGRADVLADPGEPRLSQAEVS